ncbi:thioesterase family protein [Actinomycetospora endophytica]|uniref:Thioesterase family protein n=1 Tax=Actinomycetospora endophytica TaxID=2291215 RepID=A0ABS8PA24_9PSEU|nr:thioesterase family protein [Actinomycetospora endophytica]MCD2194974.1 thioesterase family protein [Actinomycetospora endophytica]
MSSPAPEPYFTVVDVDTAQGGTVTRVEASGSTAGPWFADAQHMGPPSALLVRALERESGRDDVRLARMTVEVLGKVPVGALELRAHVARPGRTIELVSAELAAPDPASGKSRAVARAAGWFHGVVDTAGVGTVPGSAMPGLPGPEEGTRRDIPDGWLPGYLTSVDWRWIDGGLDKPGPGRAWGRVLTQVVAGEEPSPAQRLAALADSTNGVASRLDLRDWLFVNTDLTLHLHRAPRGEWTGLDADSVIGPEGTGTAYSVLHDEAGPVGRAAQALTVRPR